MHIDELSGIALRQAQGERSEVSSIAVTGNNPNSFGLSLSLA